MREASCVVRLEGDVGVASAAELKRLLIESISSRKELRLELACATDLDVTVLQLLWAARCEADRSGTRFSIAGDVPANLLSAVLEAGFANFPVPLSPETEAKSKTPWNEDANE